MGFTELYNHYMIEKADVRTNDWFLIHSPIPLGLILISYLYFVLGCGPRYMKNRQPLSLKTYIKYYNIFQIVVNALLVYYVATSGWTTHINFGCVPFDYGTDPISIRLTHVIYWTFIVKIIDLSETAVFIFRKKNNQISGLHLYHHVTTCLFAWLSCKYWTSYMGSLTLLINCGVHVIMYTYYLLSSTGKPSIQGVLKVIKPYITIVQMVRYNSGFSSFMPFKEFYRRATYLNGALYYIY
ncbi:elongation of very long chain fatty acids protein AAEL008004 isoform X2 [Cephus cinctus]|uniref:Elongation of very long chain fatty acids protein n=1 Tax=Cephus cinctus TaxID=211228 RepID=A0AAJ7RLB3_CEPCN|nr:elongation of very long chain fatty acids protein AAEL008004 isoform X2 [Cephus cinctus]